MERAVPACLNYSLNGAAMRDEWNFLHHPRLTSVGESMKFIVTQLIEISTF